MALRTEFRSVFIAWIILSNVLQIVAGDGGSRGVSENVWGRRGDSFAVDADVGRVCSGLLHSSLPNGTSTLEGEGGGVFGNGPSIGDFGIGRWSGVEDNHGFLEGGGEAILRISDVTKNPIKPSIFGYRMGLLLKNSRSFNVFNLSFSPIRVVLISTEGLFSTRSGEFCLAACAQRDALDASSSSSSVEHDSLSSSSNEDQLPDDSVREPFADCNLTISLKVEHGLSHGKRNITLVSGSVRSLRPQEDKLYFEPINVHLKLFAGFEERVLLTVAGWVECSLLVLQLLCIIWQLFYMHVRPDRAPWMSIFMVVLVFIVGIYRMGGSLYEGQVPWRDFLAGAWPDCSMGQYCEWSRCTGPHCAPFLISTAVSAFLALSVVSLNGIMLIMVCRSRRSLYNAAIKTQPLPIEKPVLFLCVPFYLVGAILSVVYGQFAAFLILMKLYFLIPQVVSNTLWDSKQKALHPIYTGGVTLALAAELVFTLYRNMESLGPVSTGRVIWLLGNPVVMVVLLFLLHSQQSSLGGRWFVPQGWLRTRREASSLSEEEIALVENPSHRDRSEGAV